MVLINETNGLTHFVTVFLTGFTLYILLFFYLSTMLFALKNWFCFHLVITDLSHVPETVCLSSCFCTPLTNVPSFHTQSMHQLCLIPLLFFLHRLFLCFCLCPFSPSSHTHLFLLLLFLFPWFPLVCLSEPGLSLCEAVLFLFFLFLQPAFSISFTNSVHFTTLKTNFFSHLSQYLILSEFCLYLALPLNSWL